MQEGEGEHLHRGGAGGGGGEQLQRGGGYEVQHREEDGEESKAGEQLQEDPDEDVCKEEMQEGAKSQSFILTPQTSQVPRKCYETVKMSREERPKERCSLKPRRICRGGGCR